MPNMVRAREPFATPSFKDRTVFACKERYRLLSAEGGAGWLKQSNVSAACRGLRKFRNSFCLPCHGATHSDIPSDEIDVRPVQRDELSSTHAGPESKLNEVSISASQLIEHGGLLLRGQWINLVFLDFLWTFRSCVGVTRQRIRLNDLVTCCIAKRRTHAALNISQSLVGDLALSVVINCDEPVSDGCTPEIR